MGFLTYFGPPLDGIDVPATQPKVNVNTGGIIYQEGQTTFDKVLASILSGLALYKNAPYVPTTHQPIEQPIVSPYGQYPAGYPAGYPTGTTGTGDSIESFIQNNKGLLLMVGVAVVLFMSGRK